MNNKNNLDRHTKIKLGKQAEELAERQRKEWELHDKPIPNIFSLLENKGILILRFPSSDCDLSGFAMTVWGKNCVYINSNDVLGRQNFSAAHELCHLINDLKKETIKVCFHSLEESEEDEYRAQRFASEFLMPKDGVNEECNSLLGSGNIRNATQVIELQHIYKVSFSAMLSRLLSCKRITKFLYDELRRLSLVERIPDLQKETIQAGKSLDLILKTEPYIPERFLETINENYKFGLITGEKYQSLLHLLSEDFRNPIPPGGEP